LLRRPRLYQSCSAIEEEEVEAFGFHFIGRNRISTKYLQHQGLALRFFYWLSWKFGFRVFTSVARIRWNQAPCPVMIQYFQKAYGIMAHKNCLIWRTCQKSVMITYCVTRRLKRLWPAYKCIIWWQYIYQFWRN
jgi:hypothetical protein